MARHPKNSLESFCLLCVVARRVLLIFSKEMFFWSRDMKRSVGEGRSEGGVSAVFLCMPTFGAHERVATMHSVSRVSAVKMDRSASPALQCVSVAIVEAIYGPLRRFPSCACSTVSAWSSGEGLPLRLVPQSSAAGLSTCLTNLLAYRAVELALRGPATCSPQQGPADYEVGRDAIAEAVGAPISSNAAIHWLNGSSVLAKRLWRATRA